MYKILECNH